MTIPSRYSEDELLDPMTERARRRRIAVVSISAVLVTAAAIVGAAVWLGGGESTPGGTTTSPTASVETSPAGEPSATAAGGAATSAATGTATSAPVTVQKAVAVYYVSDSPLGPRLYREFHRVQVPDGDAAGTARVALTEMFGAKAQDPDYTSSWPAGTTVRSLTVTGSRATVDVSDFVAVGAAFETAAVQQLVYTVTAAAPQVKQVTLLVDGAVPPSGHSDWSAPIARAPALDVQAFVWILAPTEGASTTSPVRVRVYGTGYEGTVPLKVFRGGTEVASTFVTTEMGAFREAATSISLPPGTYELRAYNDSGKDASLTLWDTKTFTVR